MSGLSSLFRKNISFNLSGKSRLQIRPSRPIRGALAIVTNVGRDAVDVFAAKGRTARKRTAKSCGPDASTPASSWRRCSRIALATVTRKPDHRLSNAHIFVAEIAGD
jgi:hypothetical protein